MCIFRDPSSQIEDNNSNNSTIDYRSNPNANWNTLMSDTEKKLALRELITIYKQFHEPQNRNQILDFFSNFYYENVFKWLDATNELQHVDKPQDYRCTNFNLINLQNENIINFIPPAIVYQACVVSSIFLVIKQLAASSGYKQSQNPHQTYTLTLECTQKNINEILQTFSDSNSLIEKRFFKSENERLPVDTITIKDDNHIAFYYEKILLKKIGKSISDLNNRTKLFEILTNPRVHMGEDWNEPTFGSGRSIKYELLTFLKNNLLSEFLNDEDNIKKTIVELYNNSYEKNKMYYIDSIYRGINVENVIKRIFYYKNDNEVNDICNELRNKTKNSIKTTIDNILKERYYKNYVDIHSFNETILKYYARYYYYALTNRTIINASDRPRTIIIAYGDGSSTVGFLNIKDLGCVLFNFQNTVTEKSIRLSRNEQMHFHVFGYNPAYPEEESPYKHIYTLKIRDSTGFELPLRFEGTRDCKNGLKPKRLGKNNSTCYYTSPSYDLPTDNNIIDNDRYTDFYYFNGNQNERIARFDNSDNILKIYKEDVTVDFDIKPEEPDLGIDEIVFIATVAPDNFSKRYNLIYFNEFDSGKFELTQEEIQELYRQNKQAFDTIFDNLKNKDFSFYVGMGDTSTITGEFVGKKSSNNYEYSPNDIVADTQYSFCYYSNTPEILPIWKQRESSADLLFRPMDMKLPIENVTEGFVVKVYEDDVYIDLPEHEIDYMARMGIARDKDNTYLFAVKSDLHTRNVFQMSNPRVSFCSGVYKTDVPFLKYLTKNSIYKITINETDEFVLKIEKKYAKDYLIAPDKETDFVIFAFSNKEYEKIIQSIHGVNNTQSPVFLSMQEKEKYENASLYILQLTYISSDNQVQYLAIQIESDENKLTMLG